MCTPNADAASLRLADGALGEWIRVRLRSKQDSPPDISAL